MVPIHYHDLHFFFLHCLMVLAVIYLAGGLDDFFVDVVALVGRLKPRRLDKAELAVLDGLPEKNIAILVPAWKESGIIRRMLLGNLAALEYRSFHFFVGVYPNDPATIAEVEALSREYPNIHAVVNRKAGPTSKGQMLNYALSRIRQVERKTHLRFDAALMQDAEDLMHPKVLKLVNRMLDRYDFVQVPVFSLDVRARELVAGTYVDEFAESHTKDLLVREWLGSAVPSAGVGTALSRRLILELARANDGHIFNERSVAEDYELGIQAHRMGLKPHFACCYYAHPETGRREYIATREYFPKRLMRSIRQKTRWTMGIALIGSRSLGWHGSLVDKYFLTRDRKGIVTNPLALAGYACVAAASLTSWLDPQPLPPSQYKSLIETLLAVNIALMANRIYQRARCVMLVYGLRAALPIPVRWPLAVAVNACASLHAVRQDLVRRLNKGKVIWVKTEHELPVHFGQLPQRAEASG